MLGDLENQLVQLIKESPLGLRLKTVDSLPDVPDKDVLNRWGVDAPAAYVVAMDGTLADLVATPRFVVVMVARNAKGHQEARHGSKAVIGLYEMVDAGVAYLHGGVTEGGSWQVTGYQFQQDNALRDKGLYVSLLAVQCNCDTPEPAQQNLGDFLEFHADFDLEPHTPGEHERWLGENHDAPAPDLQSSINPQEER